MKKRSKVSEKYVWQVVGREICLAGGRTGGLEYGYYNTVANQGVCWGFYCRFVVSREWKGESVLLPNTYFDSEVILRKEDEL